MPYPPTGNPTVDDILSGFTNPNSKPPSLADLQTAVSNQAFNAKGRFTNDGGPIVITKNGHDFQYDSAFKTWVDLGKTTKEGADSSWSGQYHNDALIAAQDAMSAFLQAQTLSDARRLSALDSVQKLGAFALPAGATTAPGYEAGGPAQQLAAMQGRSSYTPPPIRTVHVDPSQLMNPGQLDPTVLAMIAAIRDAANQGRVITTGGSSSNA